MARQALRQAYFDGVNNACIAQTPVKVPKRPEEKHSDTGNENLRLNKVYIFDFQRVPL